MEGVEAKGSGNGTLDTFATDLLPAIHRRWGRVDAVVADLKLPTTRAFVFIVCDEFSSYRMDVDIEIANSPGIFAPALSRELDEMITNIGGLNAFRQHLIASAMPAAVHLDGDDCGDWQREYPSQSIAAYH